MKIFGMFNKKLAVKITLIFGSMWTAHFLLLMALTPLILPQLTPVIMYISTTVIQLVALSWLAVGNNVLSEKQETRSQQDHETIMKEFALIKKINEEQNLIINELREILNKNKKNDEEYVEKYC